MRVVVTALVLLAMPPSAWAHRPSDAQLRLAITDDRVSGRLDIAVRDLDAALAVDDGDGALTWAELSAAAPRIADYVASRVTLDECHLDQGTPAVVDLSDGAYWSIPLSGRCDHLPTHVTLRYGLLFDVDAQHRGLVTIGEQTLVVHDREPVHVSLAATTSAPAFVREGVWHIWIGLDHILFLLCLLLPAVFPRRGTAPAFRTVAAEVFEIVTAFTLAHSITLVVSAAGLVALPSRFVETAIALSVVLAAINNLVRAVDARWAVAFALGLLHGFGFSSVLVDLGLPSHQLVGALLGFNLGVELGQGAIVLAVLPVLYAMRTSFAYRVLLFAGSGAAALVASVWTYQRMLA